MKIVDLWKQLFEMNELLRKKSSTPLTDQELRLVAQAAFPSNKRAASIQRVSWMRHQYNAGTGFYRSRGRARIRSHAYDAEGRRRTS
jgi:hypothetical protein